jgi:ribosomal protein S4
MAKRKKSEYAIQLMEKQKAKYSYGILETIQRFIQKHQLLKELLVKFYYNYASWMDN